MTDMWQTVASERGALASDLADLTGAQWDSPSLCERWTVRQVLAHMTNTGVTGPVGFFAGLARSGFRFGTFVENGIEKQYGATPAETLSRFADIQNSTTSPPGPRMSWLGETTVHAEDIRRPLGLQREYPADAVVPVLDFYKNSNALIGSKNRIAGLALRATDLTWSHGDGPAVEGRAIDLLLAMTGRGVACDALTGEGVATLRTRA